MALSDLITLSNLNRLEDLERREKSNAVTGDFEGSVGGSWVRLDEDGAGIVSYNDKEYVTKRLGFTSIPAGTAVELSFGNGIYYSKW
jgi:hypothetical protein